MSTVIYSLAHPVTGRLRYVGKTVVNLKTRLNGHIYKARSSRTRTPVGQWIRQILNKGLKPIIEQLAIAVGESWQAAERRWIETLRERGARLLNLHAGGNGAHTRSTLRSDLIPLLGHISDQRIAERAGLCRETITYHRRRAGITRAYDWSRCGGKRGQVASNRLILPDEIIANLGKVSDYALANSVGCSKGAIQNARKRQSIAAYTGPKRMPTGEQHAGARLTAKIVRLIRQNYTRRCGGELARKYSVSISTIWSIVRQKTWKRV